MKDKRFHGFPHRQIPVFIVLWLVPGLGYRLLGWLNDVLMPALVRYMLMIATSIWGARIYRNFDFDTMSERRRDRCYQQCAGFMYACFPALGADFPALCAAGRQQAALHHRLHGNRRRRRGIDPAGF
jgi:hypothetical protein